MMKKLKVLEKHVRLKLRTMLKLKGWFVFYNLQTMGAYKGLSDLVAVKRGIVIWIEVKKPGGRQATHQIKFQRDIEAAGGYYFCADSWSAVDAYLKEHGWD